MKLLLAFAALLIAPHLSRAADTPGKLPAGVREISIEETEKLLAERKDIAVLDVRTAPEVAEHGRLPRARNVDFFFEDFKKAVMTLQLDPAKPVIVYCAIGGRARRAAEKLAQYGFKEVLLPKGSFKAWKEAGKPVEGAAKK